MEKFFNTAGPINPDLHYFIPLEQRVDVEGIMLLIEQQKYFVLHAPRQSGKTTALKTLANRLNEAGRYICLYANVEGAQAMREDIPRAMRAILSCLIEGELHFFGTSTIERHLGEVISVDTLLAQALAAWARHSRLPTVLFLDEIDSLIGDTLVTVLRQLRGGYANRPKSFPQSVILCGVRDIRDYRIVASKEKEPVTGGSCFNVNARSLTMANFTKDEVAALYGQHTAATGQKFAAKAIDLAWDLTRGQPWLVNALAYEVCFEQKAGRDRKHTVTADDIHAAKEALIQRRVTHLDQLADKLKEPRVRGIIEPMLRGESLGSIPEDDMQYCVDLGLVKIEHSRPSISNPIYQEVIPRQLNYIMQLDLPESVATPTYQMADGSLDMTKLLTDFQQFFRENAESWGERFEYLEAGPHLLLQAFLQRVLNGGGRIYREYGLGRGRTDLLVEWPKGKQRVVIELKVQHKTRKLTTEQGLVQTAAYMDQTDTTEGHLVIFDRTPKKPWSKKIYRKAHKLKGKKITVWGM